jgi:hypothetical protein
VHGAVVTADFAQTLPCGTQKSVGQQGSQGAEHPAVRHVPAVLEADRRPIQCPECRQHPFVGAGAAGAESFARARILNAALRLVQSRAGRPLPPVLLFVQAAIPHRPSQRVPGHAQLLCRRRFGKTFIEEFLRTNQHLGGEHTSAITHRYVALEKRLDSTSPVLPQCPVHVALGDPKSFDRFRGAAGARIDQLCKGQPEGTQIPGPMPVNRMHSQQITPMSSIVENPYVIVD